MSYSVALVGPRCSGKTSVGSQVSDLLAIRFFDLDGVFTERYGSVADFVARSGDEEEGWNRFRMIEAGIVRQYCEMHRPEKLVLAPGGGAVAHDQGERWRIENTRRLRDFGTVFYLLPDEDLSVSAEVLATRMTGDPASARQRPALDGAQSPLEEMKAQLPKRHPLYQAAAHHTIYTGAMGIDEVAARVVETLRQG